jgi:hypothetical protein
MQTNIYQTFHHYKLEKEGIDLGKKMQSQTNGKK